MNDFPVSAFVGLAIIIVMFPFPGYVTKLIQDAQKIKMKKTDARVQMVTESESVPLLWLHPLSMSSYECPTHGQVLRMGVDDEPKNYRCQGG